MVIIDKLPHGRRSPFSHSLAAVPFAEGVRDMGISMEIAFPSTGPIRCICSAFIELFSVGVEEIGDGLLFNEDTELRFEMSDMLLKGDGDRFQRLNGDHRY